MTKLALVTGGSRGIGKCVVDLLRSGGWGVVAPTRGELDWGNNLDYSRYAKTFSGFGEHVDAIIFCHGTWFLDENQSVQDWIDQYTSRVARPAAFLREIPHNFIKGSAIVFVSSTQAFSGSIHTAPYACACVAQIRLMDGLSKFLEGSERVNVVACGLTNTDMGKQVIATGGTKPGAIPQSPESVARVIVDLVQDGASNGRVVRVVDGKASDARWVWE